MQLFRIHLFDRYLLKKIVPVYIVNFIVITLLLLINRLFEIADQVITKGVPITMVIEVLWYLIPSFVALTIPMAVIVSYLTIFTELSANNEIIASYSCGINPFRFFRVPLLIALLLTLGLTYFNANILPKTTIEARKILMEIKMKKPASQLVENTFAEIDKYSIYIEKAYFREGKLKNILIYEHDAKGFPSKTIVAQEGILTMYPEDAIMHMELHDGTMYEIDNNHPEQLKKIDFYNQEIAVQYDKTLTTDFVTTKSAREFTNNELKDEIALLKQKMIPIVKMQKEYQKKMNDKSLSEKEMKNLKKQLKSVERSIKRETDNINQMLIEYHKKYSLAFMPLIFATIAFALGLMTRTRQKNHSYIISIVVFIFYWITLIGGEDLGDRGFVAPFLAIWAGNIILFPIACFLSYLLWKGHFYISMEVFTNLQRKVEAYVKNKFNR